MAFDADDNPIEVIICDGTTHDVKVTPDLVSKFDLSSTETLCTNKGYDLESLSE